MGTKQLNFSNGTSPPKFKLIIGLGNVGGEYKSSYHNIGYRFIDYLSGRQKFKKQNNFEYFKNDNLILAKPLTFMNESGMAVKEVIKYFKINLPELLIVHDDSDIVLGKYKISFASRSAGHKGVESIIKILKTKDFYRLRIGVRRGRGRAGEFVLNSIRKSDLPIFKELFSKIQVLNLKV